MAVNDVKVADETGKPWTMVSVLTPEQWQKIEEAVTHIMATNGGKGYGEVRIVIADGRPVGFSPAPSYKF